MACNKEIKNHNSENFFSKSISQSIDLPIFPPKDHTPHSSHLLFSSHIHSLDSLSFLQSITGNYISQTPLPTGFQVELAGGRHRWQLGGQVQGRGRGLSPPFHPPMGISSTDAALSRGTYFPFLVTPLTSMPSSALGVGHLPLAANLGIGTHSLWYLTFFFITHKLNFPQ